MGITSTSAKEIAKIGANIEITAESGYTSASAKEIIRIAVSRGNHVTIHAASYTSTSLKEFASIGKDKVTIKI